MKNSLSDMKYTLEWIADWKTHGERGFKMITRHSKEQRENLESLYWSKRNLGRTPTWCDLDEYAKCVSTLEKASTN